jgi:hypothetical protein
MSPSNRFIVPPRPDNRAHIKIVNSAKNDNQSILQQTAAMLVNFCEIGKKSGEFSNFTLLCGGFLEFTVPNYPGHAWLFSYLHSVFLHSVMIILYLAGVLLLHYKLIMPCVLVEVKYQFRENWTTNGLMCLLISVNLHPTTSLQVIL